MNHLVALSGGKDSTAMALRLKELYPEINYIFFCTPTGDELPEMGKHWQKLEIILKQPIIRLQHKENPTIYDLIKHFKMLPNWRARWCTRILKIELAQEYYETMKPAKIYVGLRADEEEREGNKLYDKHIHQVFPLQNWEWGLTEVLSYLKLNNVEIPRRTDCAMCFYQRIDEWYTLLHDYPELYWRISDLEDEIGHTLLSPGKWKNWPNKLSELAKVFQSSRKPKRILKSEKDKCRACTI